MGFELRASSFLGRRSVIQLETLCQQRCDFLNIMFSVNLLIFIFHSKRQLFLAKGYGDGKLTG
jgi:hypothetical protein